MLIDARHNVTLPEGRYKTDPGAIIGIAIHHTVTLFFPKPDMTEAEERAHIQMIDRYHVSQGWGGFGYHTITFPSGRTYITGDLDGARAHVASRNGELIGCAFAGDHSTQQPTDDAYAGGASAVAAVRAYVAFAGLVVGTVVASRPLPIAGHRTWALAAWPTSCPGNGLAQHLDRLDKQQEEAESMLIVPLYRDAVDGDVYAQVGEVFVHLPDPRQVTRRGWAEMQVLPSPPGKIIVRQAGDSA